MPRSFASFATRIASSIASPATHWRANRRRNPTDPREHAPDDEEDDRAHEGLEEGGDREGGARRRTDRAREEVEEPVQDHHNPHDEEGGSDEEDGHGSPSEWEARGGPADGCRRVRGGCGHEECSPESRGGLRDCVDIPSHKCFIGG